MLDADGEKSFLRKVATPPKIAPNAFGVEFVFKTEGGSVAGFWVRFVGSVRDPVKGGDGMSLYWFAIGVFYRLFTPIK